MRQFKELNTIVGLVDSMQIQRRTTSLSSQMKDAFVAEFEIEGNSLVVISVVGDSEGVIGYTNKEAEALNFMEYLGLDADQFNILMETLDKKGRVLKLNKLKTKDGEYIETYGTIIRTTTTTLLEIVIPKSELIDLTQ